MRNIDTNAPKTTFLQRVLARLCDPSPARYSAAIQQRTFGRVTLDPAPTKSYVEGSPAKARTTHTTLHHAA